MTLQMVLQVSFRKKQLAKVSNYALFGCHGIGGIVGGILTGVFATKTVNPAGAHGLFRGNPKALEKKKTEPTMKSNDK